MNKNFWIKQRVFLLSICTMPLLHAMQDRPQMTDPEAVATCAGYESAVMTVAFSPDGSLLASGSSDRTVRVWPVTADGSLDPMRQPTVLQGHREQVLSVAFNPQGNLLASGSGDKTIRLWMVENGSVRSDRSIILEGHRDCVTSIAFNATATLLASGSQDSTVRVWRLAHDQYAIESLELPVPGNGRRWVCSVAFNPQGTLLVAGLCNGDITVWHISNGNIDQQPTVFRHSFGQSDPIGSVAFNARGDLLAASSEDFMHVWHIDENLHITRDTEWYAPGTAYAAVFDPQGVLLVYTAGPGLCGVRVDQGPINYSEDHFFDQRRHDHQITSPAFNHAGTLLATASIDTTVKIWRMNPRQAAINQASAPQPMRQSAEVVLQQEELFRFLSELGTVAPHANSWIARIRRCVQDGFQERLRQLMNSAPNLDVGYFAPGVLRSRLDQLIAPFLANNETETRQEPACATTNTQPAPGETARSEVSSFQPVEGFDSHGAQTSDNAQEPQECFICMQAASQELGPLNAIPCNNNAKKHDGLVHAQCWDQWVINYHTCPVCRGTAKLYDEYKER